MAPPVIDAYFEYAVQWYFDDILPRFLTAHYRGGGHGLIAEMMAAHDAGVAGIEAACAGVVATAKSRTLAARVRRQCPPTLTSGGVARGLLGLFSKQATTISGEMFQSYREVGASWQVQIFADAFMVMVPYERQKDEVLLTVFHEYIHYFESFLLRSEQPLRSREEGHHGLGDRAMTRDEAHALDAKIRRRRRIVRGAALLVVLAIAAAAILSLFEFETEQDRERWAFRIGQLEPHVGELVALEARGDAIRASWRTKVGDAPDFNAERLESIVRSSCPGAKIRQIGEARWLTLGEQGGRCLATIRARAPRAEVPSVSKARGRWRAVLRPAGRAAQWPAFSLRLPPKPDVGTEAGEVRRTRLLGLIERTKALRVATDPLRKLDAQLTAAQAPPRRDALPLLMAVPGAWSAHRSKAHLDLVLEDLAAKDWAEARRPQGDRAQVIAGWVLADLADRRLLGGASQRIARFVPIEALGAPSDDAPR